MTSLEELKHEIRNALAGIQKTRRQAFVGIKQTAMAILEMEKHMKRIEEALSRGRDIDAKDKTP